MKLGCRKLNKFDQINFAKLSGDFNPIHVDEIEARKTIAGQPIVHGVHLFLWMMDCFFKRIDTVYIDFDIKFLNQVNLDQEVTAVWDSHDECIELTGENGLVHCKAKFKDRIERDSHAL